jgi:hypothetical protein
VVRARPAAAYVMVLQRAGPAAAYVWCCCERGPPLRMYGAAASEARRCVWCCCFVTYPNATHPNPPLRMVLLLRDLPEHDPPTRRRYALSADRAPMVRACYHWLKRVGVEEWKARAAGGRGEKRDESRCVGTMRPPLNLANPPGAGKCGSTSRLSTRSPTSWAAETAQT